MGIHVGRTTIADTLAQEGLEPAPEREKRRTWKQFLQTHWDTLYGCDFFSVETLGLFGPVRHMVFLVMELRTRRVHIAGVRVDPDGEWMKQITRNLTDCFDGFLLNADSLIHDRAPLFTEAFREVLRQGGVKPLELPAQSPNLNPHAERFVKSVQHECLNHFILLGEMHLRYVVNEYVAHYHEDRYHQGLDRQLIARPNAANSDQTTGAIRRKARLGGLLSYYHREAA